jgi:hypothetical protein
MEYTIAKHGHSSETRFWNPYLKGRFPNYERFWREFIVPLTNRPHNTSLRKDISEPKEQIAMAHYSTFYHLGMAYHLLNDLSKEYGIHDFYDKILFHMGAAIDRVEELCLAISILKDGLDLSNDKMDEDDVIHAAKRFFKTRYSRAFKKWVEEHRPVSISIHTKDLSSRPSMTSLREVASFQTIARKIRHLRNIVTHNPHAWFIPNSCKIPRPDKLNDYKLRTVILYHHDPNDFEPIDELLSRYLEELTEAINQLWQHLIIWMRTTSSGGHS